MLISSLDSLTQLPLPALGLFPAVHNASVIDVADFASMPSLTSAIGKVYRNSGTSPIILPAGGAFPGRNLFAGESFSSNGIVFFKVIRKTSLTRPVIGIAANVFTTASPHGLVDGVAVKLAGFVGPTGFVNGTIYYVVDSTTTTFQIAATSGGSPLSASVSGITGYAHSQSTNSFYPSDFNRIAYTIPFTLQSLSVGRSETFIKQFSFRSIGAITTAVWSVIFEFGERVDDTSPAPIGPNIEGYNWLPPALEQEIVITELATTHVLGLVFKRLADGTFSGYRSLYSKAASLIPGTMPTTDDFVLRVRIGQFDTEDVSDLRGYAAYCINPAPL